jgi:hypothetical protein
MPIEALKSYQKRRRTGLFEDLPPTLRPQAMRTLKRLCARWQGRLPPWRFAILCGCAKSLTLHPRDAAWGRRMLAIVAGRARQRQCRASGIHPTQNATMVRLAKQKLKKQRLAELNPAKSASQTVNTAPWLDPEIVRQTREADQAWVERVLAHQARIRQGRG